ncbi:tripartite tricarboxylate transporter TctB family protein [Chelativorans sp. Marseille-P2723]|uniref:tripartite tricarboxylate transporter TctB family protein n=1 Tax=Chelativorans sp. Marseille-P2723 TaxID=2709133 RepID=UPI001570DCA7|nr:tripartite tricarboxylate transporter TctB family protein [Chelativorans sp. Marseille-P2723]
MAGSSTARLSTVALVVAAVGICVVYLTTQISVPPAYAKVGPTVFPYAVGAVLIILGLFLLRDAVQQRWICEATDPDVPRPDFVPIAWVVGALLANLVLIERIGFILSSTLMYALVAKGFGARRIWLAALVGFLLALVAYYGFARVLNLRMGSGFIEDLL